MSPLELWEHLGNSIACLLLHCIGFMYFVTYLISTLYELMIFLILVVRYVAPEYASTGMLNERSDVYSFGILIMEIISGRNPVDYSRPPEEVVSIACKHFIYLSIFLSKIE